MTLIPSEYTPDPEVQALRRPAIPGSRCPGS